MAGGRVYYGGSGGNGIGDVFAQLGAQFLEMRQRQQQQAMAQQQWMADQEYRKKQQELEQERLQVLKDDASMKRQQFEENLKDLATKRESEQRLSDMDKQLLQISNAPVGQYLGDMQSIAGSIASAMAGAPTGMMPTEAPKIQDLSPDQRELFNRSVALRMVMNNQQPPSNYWMPTQQRTAESAINTLAPVFANAAAQAGLSRDQMQSIMGSMASALAPALGGNAFTPEMTGAPTSAEAVIAKQQAETRTNRQKAETEKKQYDLAQEIFNQQKAWVESGLDKSGKPIKQPKQAPDDSMKSQDQVVDMVIQRIATENKNNKPSDARIKTLEELKTPMTPDNPLYKMKIGNLKETVANILKQNYTLEKDPRQKQAWFNAIRSLAYETDEQTLTAMLEQLRNADRMRNGQNVAMNGLNLSQGQQPSPGAQSRPGGTSSSGTGFDMLVK